MNDCAPAGVTNAAVPTAPEKKSTRKADATSVAKSN
jgi:hypothetical protein